MYEIKRRDLNSFFKAPYEIYGDEVKFVSELKSDLKRFLSPKNPLFTSDEDFDFYTIFENGKVVGRIVTHIHHASNKLHNLNRSYFGYFDCINNVEVAKKLLDLAVEFGKKHGCTEIAGNFNLTAMQKIGVVTDIFINDQYTDQVMGAPYIKDLLAECGYEEFFPMHTYELYPDKIDEKLFLGEKQKKLLDDPKFTILKPEKKNFKKILEDSRICLNDGFKDNPMFVALSEEEMNFQAEDLGYVIDKDISYVSYYDSEPVGCLIVIPDLNPLFEKMGSKIGLSTPFHYISYRRKNDRALIILYSVKQKFHNMGINAIMLHDMIKNCKAKGYKTVGGTWIAEENKPSIRQAEKLQASKMHRLALYRKAI